LHNNQTCAQPVASQSRLAWVDVLMVQGWLVCRLGGWLGCVKRDRTARCDGSNHGKFAGCG